MREHDFYPAGYVSQFDQISPEAHRAQRMAELKSVAEWKARRLKEMQDWSDPVKRATRQAKLATELEEAKAIWAEMLEKDVASLPSKPFWETVRMRPIAPKLAPKLSWYKRLWNRLAK